MRRLLVAALMIVTAPTGVAAVAAPQDQSARDAGAPRFWLASAATLTPLDVERTPALGRRLTLKLKDVSLKRALGEIATQSGVRLAYSDDILPPTRRVNLSASGITVVAALTDVLYGTGLDVLFTRDGRASVVPRDGQRRVIRRIGVVTGVITAKATGQPLKGANVSLPLGDTTLYAAADERGGFIFGRVPAGEYAVTARYIGYRPLTKRVAVDTGSVRVDFALETQAQRMQELITTATGQQRRRDLGNAITTIQADSVLRSAPIRNLTDLLDNRVPGMSLQHTSGAPGDPARIRLRGLASVMRGNDPVVIVDGVRIYSAQSEARSGNLTNLGTSRVGSSGLAAMGVMQGNVPAPSPLDQIDPNTIEKVEVFKGPSAATLYGADAANGVIVITTKRGKPGPTRWEAHLIQGRTVPAGQYPTGYYRWGHVAQEGSIALCPLTYLGCLPDSLVLYQALNDPDMTIFGRGRRTELSLAASGGSQALTYSVTGTYGDELGLLRLPAFEASRFENKYSRQPPDWMRRPHQLRSWSVASNVTAILSGTADLSLSTRLSRSEQKRTSLENQQAVLAGSYVDKVNGIYYLPSNAGSGGYNISPITGSSPIYGYYQRTTASTITFTTGLTANWRPRNWLTGSAQAGLDVAPREDESLVPSGLISPGDSGILIRGSGQSLQSTFDLRGQVRRPLRWGFVFTTDVGTNLSTSTTNDVISSATGLVPGTASLSGAAHASATDSRVSTSVFGWYIEPKLSGQRFSLSTGLRLDGGSSYGARLTRTGGGLFGGLLGLPKLNGSWVISEEPWFPMKSLFSSLRLRGAYGQAQVQPGATDRLRLYTRRIDGSGELLELTSVGNDALRPERSTEFEGGFDADVFDSRVSVEVTAYRKMQVDALMPVELPISVKGGGKVIQNIGNIRNTGVELTARVTPVQSSLLTWSATLNYSRNNNVLTKLGRGVLPNPQTGFVAGYPVGGRWSRPILGFADRDGNGVIEVGEVQVGDSLVFMGRLMPAYESAVLSDVELFGGAVRVSAALSYDAGQTQIDQTARTNWVLSRALADPSTPLDQQAAVVVYNVTDYGLTQTVSTFRFKSLSVAYRAPTRVARALGANQLSIALQGDNLGLHSTYRGKDPDVTAWSPTEHIVDTGQLARPRTWQLRFDVRY